MTIEELKSELDKIPKKGAINKARRVQIQRMIFEKLKDVQAND